MTPEDPFYFFISVGPFFLKIVSRVIPELGVEVWGGPEESASIELGKPRASLLAQTV